MGEHALRSGARAALAALFICGPGCHFPSAWSPDSGRAVLLVGSWHERISRLVMIDLSGKRIRDVARAHTTTVRDLPLGPASWSPDGRWIAYLKFQPTDGRAPDVLAASLMLQDAASGRERRIWKGEVKRSCLTLESRRPDPTVVFGPQWLGDSRSLVISTMAREKPDLLVLDMQGRVQHKIPLRSTTFPVTVTFSPDGGYLAYVANRPEARGVALYLHDRHRQNAREIVRMGTREGRSPDTLFPPPAWSADSRSLFFYDMEVFRTPNRKRPRFMSLVKRFDVGSGRITTLWQTQESGVVVNLSVAAKAPRLAVTCIRRVETRGVPSGSLRHVRASVHVVNLEDRSVVPIHFTGTDVHHFAPAMSPDGRWVALSVSQEGSSAGIILSSDGRQLRFFAPGPPAKTVIRAFVRARVWYTLEYLGLVAELEGAKIRLDERPTIEQVNRAVGMARRIAAQRTAPIFKEAATWGSLEIYLRVMEELPAEKRGPFAAVARAGLAELRKAHPDHLFGAILAEELGQLSGR